MCGRRQAARGSSSAEESDKPPLFNVTRRGKVTYYMEGDGVISSLVTKREADGDLLVSAAELFAMALLCLGWFLSPCVVAGRSTLRA